MYINKRLFKQTLWFLKKIDLGVKIIFQKLDKFLNSQMKLIWRSKFYHQMKLGKCFKEKSKREIGYYQLKSQKIISQNINKRVKKDGKQETQ